MPRHDARLPHLLMTAPRRAALLVAASLLGGACAAAATDETITVQHVLLRDGRTLDGIQHGRVFDCYDLATGHMIGTINKVFPEDVISSEDETINVLPAGAVAPGAGGGDGSVPTGPVTGHGLGGKWGSSYKAALASAKRTGRPLLMLFTFNDDPGKAFDTDIGQSATFKEWVKDRMVLLRIDLGKDQLPLLKTQDDELVRVHHVSEHPTIVVCDTDGKELFHDSYHNNSPDTWITEFQKKVNAAAPPPSPPPPPVDIPPTPAPGGHTVLIDGGPAKPPVNTPPVEYPPIAKPTPVDTPPVAKPTPVDTPPVAKPTPPPVTQPPVVQPPVPIPPVDTPPVVKPPVVVSTPIPPPIPPPPVAIPKSPKPATTAVATLTPSPPLIPPSSTPSPPMTEELAPVTLTIPSPPVTPSDLIGTWVIDVDQTWPTLTGGRRYAPGTTSGDDLNRQRLGASLAVTITATTVTYAFGDPADTSDPGTTKTFQILDVSPDTVIMRPTMRHVDDGLGRIAFAYHDQRIYLSLAPNAAINPVLVLMPKSVKAPQAQ